MKILPSEMLFCSYCSAGQPSTCQGGTLLHSPCPWKNVHHFLLANFLPYILPIKAHTWDSFFHQLLLPHFCSMLIDLLVITFSVSNRVQQREINTSASEPGFAADWHGHWQRINLLLPQGPTLQKMTHILNPNNFNTLIVNGRRA